MEQGQGQGQCHLVGRSFFFFGTVILWNLENISQNQLVQFSPVESYLIPSWTAKPLRSLLRKTTQQPSHSAQILRKGRDDSPGRIKEVGERIALAVHPLAPIRCNDVLIVLRGRSMNGVGDLIDGAEVWSVERGANALGVGVIELGLPRCRGASGFSVDVVEETAAPTAAALVGGHGCVHYVDAPFDVSGGWFGYALAAADGGYGLRGLRDWSGGWSWGRHC